ncbi:MAG: PDZ domain-containing protein [Deltaproteobacteria bacterium]|nr:PDZ domain-containing protein [Deltaproteobacteria bacterium]MBZ0220610.1 PDZ domain-containing protein [Deltaproteobacteria bacterium]
MRNTKSLLAVLFLTLSFLITQQAYAQDGQEMARTMPEAQAERPWLGVTIQSLDPERAAQMGMPGTTGVIVSDVASGSPAQVAGLMPGDVITEAGGQDVRNASDLITAIRSAGVGKNIELDVMREGAEESFSVQLSAMPRGAMQERGRPMMGGMGGMMAGDCPMGMGGMGPGMRGHGMGMMGPGMMMGMDRMGHRGKKGTMMGHFYGRMMMAVKALDLTPEQKARATEIYTNFRKQAIRTGADIKIAKLELHQLLMADPVNMESVTAKVNEIARKQADLMMAGIRGVEEFKKTLTPEQRGQLRGILAMDSGAGDDMEELAMDSGEMDMTDMTE